MFEERRQVRFDHRIQRRLFRTVTAAEVLVGDAHNRRRRCGVEHGRERDKARGQIEAELAPLCGERRLPHAGGRLFPYPSSTLRAKMDRAGVYQIGELHARAWRVGFISLFQFESRATGQVRMKTSRRSSPHRTGAY